MSLKNIFFSLIAIVIIIMIIITSNNNQATVASPEGEDLNPILVSTETITYHDSAALYQGEMAGLIDNPYDINTIIKKMNNIVCKRSPVSEESDIITAATHRVRFNSGGVTLYLDNQTGAFWYDYQEIIPNKYLIGFTQSNSGERFALVYLVKNIDQMNEFIAALDASANDGMSTEYHYTPIDNSEIRGEYRTVDDLTDETAKEKTIGELESIKAIEMPLDSSKSVDFVLREKTFGINNDLISIMALKPNQGGLRQMNQAFPFDSSQAGPVIMETIFNWDENYQATKNALFRIIIIDPEAAAAE